jgi:hypothetical protein
MPTTIAPPLFKATYRLRESYGRVLAYPVSREATLLCQLTGTKTLRYQDLDTIRELGFDCIDTDGKVIDHSILF